MLTEHSGIGDKKPIGLTSVLLGNVFPPSAQATRFDQGISPNQATDGVSDNITSGVYASAPDQGLGFYFGGMVSANRTAMTWSSSDNAPDHPTIASTTFTKVDMTTPNDAKFQTMAWPNGTTPRSQGGLVWLPFGKKGVLLAIGGVEIPGDLFLIDPPRVTKNSTFMTDILIYDIDADRWYTQSTLETGEKPSQLASFCTAVVPTQDKKSYEIVAYGGYDGTYASSQPGVRDDIWVLSVPAFQWTKVVPAQTGSTHGRQGSVCFAPNPTTMITVGGNGALGGSLKSDTLIDVLDLNTFKWTGKYNSSSSEPFVAPDAIVQQLGWVDGKGPGNSPVRGLNSSLNDLFSTAYTGQVKTYYPYSTYNPNNGTVIPTNGSTGNTGTLPEPNSEPKWKIPVIAVLCTIGGLAIIAVIVFLYMRKRRQASQQHHRKQHSGVFAWLSKSSHSTSDGQTEKWTDAGESTAIGSDADYFNNPKARRNTDIYEITGDMASPAASSPGGHTFVSSAVSRPQPQELMGGGSTSTHLPHTRNTSGIQSESGTDTYMGRPFIQRSTSVHELPQGRSEEDLPRSLPSGTAASVSHRPGSSEQMPSAISEHPPSSTAFSPGLTVVNDSISISDRSSSPVNPASPSPPRPYHHRNQSSLSENLPDLPSPPLEEDKRQSRQLQGLPEVNSPLSPPLPPLREKNVH